MTSEYRVIFVSVGTRIDAFETKVLLPFGRDDPFAKEGYPGPDGIYLKASYCFLAHIRIRQTLSRSKEIRTPDTPHGRGSINFAVINALLESLQSWYETLPPYMRFVPSINCIELPTDGPIAEKLEKLDDNLSWLRSFYFSCHAVFVWSMVVEAATSTDANFDGQVGEAVKRMAFGIIGTIASTSQYMNGRFHPIVWTQSQR